MKYFIFLTVFFFSTSIQAQTFMLGPAKGEQAKRIVAQKTDLVTLDSLKRKEKVELKETQNRNEVPSKKIFGILIPIPIIWMFVIILWMIAFVVALSAWMHKMKIPPMGKLK